MSLRRPSLHSVVAFSLFCMGVLALALVLLSSWIYREVAYDNRAAAIRDLVRTQTANITAELQNSQRILALRLARSGELQAAWRRGDTAQLAARLETVLASERETGPQPSPLLQIRLRDAALTTVAVAGVDGGALACPEVIAQARQSVVGNGISRTCLQEDRASSTVLIPLTGLDPGGYVEVVADPVVALKRIADAPDLALRIERPGGRRLYESGQWATWSRGKDALTVTYLAPGDGGDPIFAMQAAAEVGLLSQQLSDTRDFVLIAAAIIVAGAILAVLIMVRRMLQPLRALQHAAERVSVDGAGARDFQPVEARGPVEIATPIRSFNQMVGRIGSLLGELEAEVGQRREAELAATAAKEEAEANALRASQEKEFSQITLESVVDAVIATDTEGRVSFMNAVAEHLTGVTEQEAHGQPIDELLTLGAPEGKPNGGLVAACLRGEAARSREPRTLEHPSGRTLHVEFSAVPMQDADGRVLGAVAVLHDVTRARMLTERLTYQATHDALTGLINRYEFESRLQQALEASAAGAAPGVLCYLDLDQFKLVNDTCGHVAGDELLRQLAAMMRERVGERGVFARLGGDEFGLLIHPGSITEARTIVDDLRDAVQRFRFVWAQSIFSIGVSVGMVEINEHTESTEMLLSAADTACYMAKDQGRNRVQVYQADDEALLARHAEMQWVSEINRALEADRFRLYCQDILAANGNGERTHFELLLRLRDEEGRLWSPGAFLSAAERYNLAPAIDQWVLRRAMAWIAANDVPEEAVYSINLSGRSLADRAVLEFLLAELDRVPVRPQNLCFEVTETAAISNLSFARTFMESVRNRGCRFSLDDFGSGLSSFTYLQNLPVDYLKIDGSFVRDIHEDPVHYAMVRSMNEVGHAMEMETIAEFVEHDEVLTCLRDIGVDYVQGYRYSRPRPLDVLQAEADLAEDGARSAGVRTG
ncbi:MAG: EAL domain-containing protein [Halofilum sp. (in: g-proteobacteria)]|nr:EAL domain-containing protein [Halofilum sp. (in: g-proteobacteria)]